LTLTNDKPKLRQHRRASGPIFNPEDPMATNDGANDISLADGAKLVQEAKAWKGTPYALVGSNSVKGINGDCSGSSWRIYSAAGFVYDYRNSASFPAYAIESKKFRKLEVTEAKQEGDMLVWSDHMAIYTSFISDTANATTPRVNAKGTAWTQHNDMWTATRPGGGPYQPNKMSYFKPTPPAVYRFQK
jgi:hypothetical protein